jgi:hypothetical protein
MEEAYDLCGLELRSGYSFRGAKRALNLVFLEWQNKGLNLWTVEQASVSVTEGTSSYTVESSALDIVDVFIRTDAGDETKQFDQRLNRISRTEYNHQSNKLLQAKPTQFYVDKDSGSIKLVLWSTPDKAYTLVYDYIQRIEDTGDVASNNVDVPSRYLPCLTYALAYNLAVKSPEAQPRVPMIKQRYDELWKDVSDADRERASVKFVPDLGTYGY